MRQQRWIVRAPGRVNLIGEHTDYNDGFVLPAAIDLEIRLDCTTSTDRSVEVTVTSTGEVGVFDLDHIGPTTGRWIDYVAGVASVLQASGHRLSGLHGRLASTLPVSAGLSSSAALELAAALAMLGPEGAEARGIDPMTLARLCQQAENEYVGVRCGLMDQVAVACGVAGSALLLDCRTEDFLTVDLRGLGLALVVVDTGERRRLADSAYEERRTSCERAVAILAGNGMPVLALRDVTLADLATHAALLDPQTVRRCRHVIEENRRVVETVAAIAAGDRQALGELFAASHASLRDDYEVSSPGLDAAVEVASRTPGVVASRMTGAGFGGCTVNLVEPDAVPALELALADAYRSRTGLQARVYRCEPTDGARLIGSIG